MMAVELDFGIFKTTVADFWKVFELELNVYC
jgi:hypothetical protein